eukprot:CAMPEP_0172850760 /NCGR_PEP_ID=MMETSP1075-20121228/50163_1 /TAXON_ID=2916 /ORGANISM="Ceratium fusus, Strain PA161109" /LENGTH=55 /DNA_ID=CAMNT_0013696665 /DNA_START=32 /DNA_END=199 /DNA_ORIENTATION=-
MTASGSAFTVQSQHLYCMFQRTASHMFMKSRVFAAVLSLLLHTGALWNQFVRTGP